MRKGALPILAGAAAVAAMTVGLVAGPATGRVLKGTKKSDKVTGTARADTIRLGSGNDRARGRGGGDRILGGAGRDVLAGNGGRDRLSGGASADRLSGGSSADRLSGGSAADRLRGGAGNDFLNAVDRRKDARVDAGSGRNTCRLDMLDLKVARGCFKIAIGKGRLGVPGGGGSPGGGSPGGGGQGGGGQGGGATGPLALSSASGLTCASNLPTCTFQLTGTGADSQVGTVTGQGGAQPGGGGAVSVSGNSWSATGAYGCTANGFLRVAIGSETLDVPVTCTA